MKKIKKLEKEFNKALEMGLKSHPMASKQIEINKESQKKLENIDDKLLIALATQNLQNYILTTCREIAIQRELKRRQRALPPDYVKLVVDYHYDNILKDEDMCSVEDFKKWYESEETRNKCGE